MWRWAISIGCLLGFPAALAFAQDGALSDPPTAEAAPPSDPASQGNVDDDDEIIVETERVIDIGAAGNLARRVAGRPQSRDTLPRFNAPFCLALAIDDTERGLAVGRRIIANARTAGVKIAKPGCRPNALVIMADDMRARIEAHRRGGRFFGGLKRHQVDRALRVSDPAYVFQDVEIVSTNRRGRLDRNTVRNIRAAAVMMENRSVGAYSPQQLADYASLRLLAPTREMNEVAAGAPRTILTLFAASPAPPPEMSRFDRVYLATLYRLRSTATAVEVLQGAARALDGSPEGRR